MMFENDDWGYGILECNDILFAVRIKFGPDDQAFAIDNTMSSLDEFMVKMLEIEPIARRVVQILIHPDDIRSWFCDYDTKKPPVATIVCETSWDLVRLENDWDFDLKFPLLAQLLQ